MSVYSPTPLVDVFSAFREGLEKGEQSAAPAQPAPAPSAHETPDDFSLLQLVQTLADAPDGKLPFSAFARQLPGDPITTLASTVRLMREGWVEFVGEVSEQSDVRLTDKGRDMVGALRGSVAPA